MWPTEMNSGCPSVPAGLLSLPNPQPTLEKREHREGEATLSLGCMEETDVGQTDSPQMREGIPVLVGGDSIWGC